MSMGRPMLQIATGIVSLMNQQMDTLLPKTCRIESTKTTASTYESEGHVLSGSRCNSQGGWRG